MPPAAARGGRGGPWSYMDASVTTLETNTTGPVAPSLVERDAELAAIGMALDGAVEGVGRALIIVGEAGTGKTRLLTEADTLAREREIHCLRARGAELERGFPFGEVGTPSLAAAGERVVAAYRRGEGAIEAATFTPDPGGARDVARTTAVEGWREVRRPTLLGAPGGGLQLFFDGSRSVNPDDPLNGAVLVPRRADGSFGSPTLAARRDWPVVTGVTDDAGVPIWATTDIFGNIFIWRGAENATSQDLGDFARGFPLDLARDANGRLWLAWETNAEPNELYMGELDPATGEPAAGATRQRAPVSGGTFGGAQLACAAGCRIVFSRDERLVSWAPGEAATTEVAAGDFFSQLLAADVAPGGGLWTAWQEDGALKVKLGDGAGAGGQPVVLRPPTADANPGGAGGLALPGRFVLALEWFDDDGSVAWAAVVPE